MSDGAKTDLRKPHPLDPLSAEEVVATANILRSAKPEMDIIFNTITLKEPPKKLMLKYLGYDHLEEGTSKSNVTVPREAFVVIIEKEVGMVYEAIVSLDDNSLASWIHIPGVQPIITAEEVLTVEALILQDEAVQAECRELGIDMNNVYADPWAIGHIEKYKGADRRLLTALMYYRNFEDDNQYAHPLDFVPVVDVTLMKVIEVERIPPKSSKFTRPVIPMENHNFLPEFLDPKTMRTDIKPIQVLQPEGVSFTVDGNQIAWQKYKFQISFNYREGLVIHNVTYQDGDKLRPLFFRMSMSEMVVPYADPESPHYRKHAFDVGEYGLGLCTNSLALGCDCLGTIHYFDAVMNDHEGRPFIVPQAICLHEEDRGLLFKHTDYRSGRAHVVRGRRLVVSQIVTVANYDYALYWYFNQDGTIEYEVKATGELNTTVLAEDEDPGDFGTIVAPQINAPHHQHFFVMRLDPMIDGVNNSVLQVDTMPVEAPVGSPENRWGNGFVAKQKLLEDTDAAQADANTATSRFWKIINPSSINPYTRKPVGYKISCMHTPPLFAKPGSIVERRAGFARKNLWVTQYDDEQMFAAGFYCNQNEGGDGLPEWTKTKKNVNNEDIVIWLTFGVTHLPRVEDFPVMPVETCGFSLKPCNFFNANPGLDVPSQSKHTNGSMLAFDPAVKYGKKGGLNPVDPLKMHHPSNEQGGSCCGSNPAPVASQASA
ncbi:copper amine oxidase [Jimgerdemannia flammicorona]|uniref:Amine oxidase n=1 Tax=Jimgerdemannia flammicorona TaxID=994334 RepID=A0A433QWQ2_9FUNG|nr:copper amine oxidase [Jimgerdemannia flammicorona]